MIPTLDQKDNILLIDKFSAKVLKKRPQKGDIVQAKNPYKPGYYIVKRVINTEGETAEFYSYKLKKNVKCEVPPGHLWLEGDNKENSSDSRNYGPISEALVGGFVIWRLYPFDKVNRL